MHHNQRSVADDPIVWLKSELAALRMIVAARRISWLIRHKYSPDQPRVPAGNPDGGTPSQYGTAVHTAVHHYFQHNYPEFNPVTGEFNTEFSVRKGTDSAYYGEKGSKRFDAYEDVGDGTVCGYDIKVGSRGLSPRRITELRSAAINFYEIRNRRLPRRVIILEVRPWR